MILEPYIVGAYAMGIFIIIQRLKINIFLALFITGFLKHFLGYISGLHTYYCNNGTACYRNIYQPSTTAVISTNAIISESCIEGVVFVLLGYIYSITKNKITFITVFIFGIVLHILSEYFGIHHEFCKRCLET